MKTIMDHNTGICNVVTSEDHTTCSYLSIHDVSGAWSIDPQDMEAVT